MPGKGPVVLGQSVDGNVNRIDGRGAAEDDEKEEVAKVCGFYGSEELG